MSFNMSMYIPTKLESFVESLYKENGILSPSDMDIDSIAEIFNCKVVYAKGAPLIAYDETDGGLIFLRVTDNTQMQRLDFYHELSHAALHVGDQRDMPGTFIEMQETQASAFQSYAAMPAYMIAGIEPANTWHEYIMNLSLLFEVPYQFAAKRIDQIKRRIFQEHHDRNFRALTSPLKARYGYTNAKEFSQ